MGNDINLIVDEMLRLPGILAYIGDVKINRINSNENEIVPAYKKFPEVVFDPSSFNFHVFPENEDVCKTLSKEFGEMIKIIRQREELNCYKVSCGNGCIKKLSKLEPNRIGNGLFKCLHIYDCKSKYFYYITPMRYTCNAEGVVGCTMRAIQFHKDTGKINLGNNGFEICYPLTANPCDKGTNSAGNVCYNPPVKWPNKQSFDMNATTYNFDKELIDEIVKHFLAFIINEGKIPYQI